MNNICIQVISSISVNENVAKNFKTTILPLNYPKLNR